MSDRGFGIRGEMFNRFAVCKAEVDENNFFDLGEANQKGTDVEQGDEVRVAMFKTDSEKFVKARDSTTYTTTLQLPDKVHIPNNTMDKLSLETGDIIGYAIVATRNMPSPSDGPIRDTVSGGTPVEARTRQKDSASFTGPVAVTGQVTVPSEVREPLNIKQGDEVRAIIGGEFEDTVKIGTGNRLTIKKKFREELNLEKGDDVEIELQIP